MATRKSKRPTRKKGGARKATARRKGSAAAGRKKRAGGKGGVPEVEFDLDDLEEMAALGIPNERMARLLHIGKATLQRAVADTPEVEDAIELGRARLDRSLRTAQVRTALSIGTPGSATLQIWLGKQLLGQRDVRAVDVTGAGGGPLELQADLQPILQEKIAEFIRSRR